MIPYQKDMHKADFSSITKLLADRLFKDTNVDVPLIIPSLFKEFTNPKP